MNILKEKNCKLVTRAMLTDHEGDDFPHFVAFNGKNLVEPSYARIVINETSDRKSKDGSEAAFGRLFPC